MSDDLNLKGRVTLDTSDSEQALARVEGGAVRMAQAVQQAGQQAGQALENGMVASVKKTTEAMGQAKASWTDFVKANMGPAMRQFAAEGATHAEAHTKAIRQIAEQWKVYKATGQAALAAVSTQSAGAAAATDKLAISQQRLLDSLAKQATIAGQGKAAWLEMRAAQLGVADQASTYIARLRQAEQAQSSLGQSAKQTAFALRGVPAQFTDIITSLASGQRPMQVMLQQGGQLKDMFGGIGPAARALGGYIVGLVNPFTIAAAVVVGLGVALHQGSEELRGFQNAATLNGNAIGLSTSRFAELRDSIAEIAGTKGKAAEALTAIASSGLSAGTNVRGIAEAAVLMEKATGQAISKTVEQFKELQRTPADAAAKLNEEFNFLTASVYKQIKALEDQGRALDAAALAERTYADALKTRAQSVVDNVGTMERAWRGIVGTAKSAWDAMLGIGRTESVGEQLAAVQKKIAGITTARGTGPAQNGFAAAQLDGLRLQESFLQEQMRLETRVTEQKTEQNRLQALGIQFEKQGDQFDTRAQQREKELTKARVEGEQLVAAGIITEKDLTERLTAIRRKYTEAVGESGIAAQRAAKLIAQAENERLQSSISTGDFSQPTKLTDAERKVILINEELKGSLLGVARANKVKELSAAQAAVQDEKNTAALQKQYDAVKKAREEITKQADAVGQQADAIQQQAISQEAANAQMGKSKTAIEESTLALLKLQAAEADASDTFDPRYVAGLNAKVEAQQRYVNALKETEFLQKSRSLDEAARVAGEEAQTLQLEVSLLGRTQQEREKIIAQRHVEVALAKELSEIDKLNLGTGPAADAKRQEWKDKAASIARVQSANAEQKTILDEWQRTADSINESLTDALLRGFESGKDFAQNLRDTLKNMFGTLVLRPIIQGVMAPVSGALAGIGQGIGGSIAGGGGSALGSLGSLAGGFGGLGSLSTAFTAGSTSVGVMAGSVAGGGGLLGGAAAALGAMGPIGWGLLAAGAAAALFGGKGGGPKNESGFGAGVPTLGDPTSSKAVADAITAQYKAIAGDLAKNLQLGVFTSADPKGTAQTQLAVNASINGRTISDRGARLGGIENVGRSQEELAAAIAEESSRVVLKALADTGLPDKIGDYLRQLGDIDKLSGGALTEAVAKLQKAMTERQTLEAQLFDLTHNDLEKLTATRQKERAALDDTNRALYDHVAALSDLTAAQNSARDSLLAAYQTQSDALRGVIERSQGFAKSLRDLRDSLSAQLPGSGSARAARARSVFDGTLSSAVAGNESALQGLGGAGTAFIEAVKSVARTPADVAAAIAKVQAGLTTAAASADGRASTAQQQLDAMTQQLSALGLLNTSVLSVGEALGAFLSAQTAIEQENLLYTAQIASENAPADVTVTAAAVVAAAAVVQSVNAPAADAERVWRAYLDSVQSGAAVGGLRSAGPVPVGELGPEIVDFETPGRVYTNEQTRGMFSSNAELLPALREVCGKLDTLVLTVRTGDVASVASLKDMAARLRKFDNDGMPAVRV